LIQLKDNAAVPLLVDRAVRPQPELVLTNAIRALAEFGDRRATSVLCQLLSSKEPMTRYDVAFALGEIGDTDALSDLRRLTADPAMPSSGDDVETIESVGEIAGKSIRKIERRRVIE
jgi:HEAT repeat protein